jgi:hypothetical protein
MKDEVTNDKHKRFLKASNYGNKNPECDTRNCIGIF